MKISSDKLTSLPPQSSKPCIFIVPEKLRQGDKESYMPRNVSIGPYHRHNSGVMQMEGHKLWYLKIFLEHNQKCGLKDYIERIRSWEDRARSCYNRQINLSPNKFAKMMLLDGIFVIQLFLMFWKPQWRLDGNQIFSMPLMVNDIRRDLLLLENQMPFFAVEGLFEMAFGSHQKHMPRLLELTYKFFATATKIEELPEAVMESELNHFLDAIRLLYLPSEREAPYHLLEEIKFIPSSTELAAAGIKLRRVESKSKGFNVKFQNGVLEIPCLNLNKLESYFRNIIAFEQCYYPVDSYLNDYIDAKLLIKKRIIEHWLGNEDAATDLINSFCKDTFPWTRNHYFNSLRHELIEHC
ncbi:hypothetical protein BT93_C0868 [Corymbia citriodora subsp. variegata]|nr:hypothetical protein BT93_C0868 [Corymbia citriodora subsp. variegata]